MCKCAFCKKEFELTEGNVLNGRFFVCDPCMTIMAVLITDTYDSDIISKQDFEDLMVSPEIRAYLGTTPPSTPPSGEGGGTILEKFPFPTEIKQELDEYIIGQDVAKIRLATAFYNHYLRVANPDIDVTLPKSNVMLLGSSGTGKTFMVETLAKLMEVPFASVDCSGITPSGWKGQDPTTMLVSLLMASDMDVDVAQNGIIYLDEIDKIAMGRLESAGGDINGRGVQQSLLKILEGAVIPVDIPGTRESVEIDTTNILFIAGGAFPELDEIMAKRLKKDVKGLGFGQPVRNNEAKTDVDITEVIHDDVIKYGFMPEFMGRFAVLAPLNNLTDEDLLKILTEPKNSLTKQYQKLLSLSGVELKFNEETLKEVVEKAKEMKTGARGLKTLMESIMMQQLYSLPSSGIKEFTV